MGNKNSAEGSDDGEITGAVGSGGGGKDSAANLPPHSAPPSHNTNAHPPPAISSAAPSTFSDDRFYGLTNFGSTCYANSVLQALYACRPFRQQMLIYYQINKRRKESESVALAVAYLYHRIASSKVRKGVLSPSVLLSRVRKENSQFDGNAHQDAQEFLIFIINNISDSLVQERQSKEKLKAAMTAAPPLFTRGDSTTKLETNKSSNSSPLPSPAPSPRPQRVSGDFSGTGSDAIFDTSNIADTAHHSDLQPPLALPSSAAPSPSAQPRKNTGNNISAPPTPTHAPTNANPVATAPTPAVAAPTWIQSIFEGVLSCRTECVRCGAMTEREESFFDLSLDIVDNTSITHCLRSFSAVEMLGGNEKYLCEQCGSRQEAYKSMLIKRAPEIAIMHIKRFKYNEQLQAFMKLGYRVAFPLELRLVNTVTAESVDVSGDPLSMYELIAVVVHIGSGARYGHYISMIKVNGEWHLYDDENITPISAEYIQHVFGSQHAHNTAAAQQDGYLLFYQKSQPNQ